MPRRRIILHPIYTTLGSTAAAFTPTDIDGLQIWLDANDLTTLFQDDAKATPVTADADPVGAWADKSGNGYDVTQATTSKKPTYKTGVQNSLPVLRFDGGDNLQRADTPNKSQPNTIFLVLKNDGAGGNQQAFDGQTAGRNTMFIFSNNWRIYAGITLTGSALDTNFHIFDAIFDGANSESFVDGASDIDDDPGSDNLKGASVGSQYGGSANFWDGDIAEVLVYDTGLSAANRQSVESYLANKWGITLA